ncbi:MAG TPA: trigger factor [Solirubrobacteraceae bacterium]|jgi:trigger factor|nr:trigger factor [Solirubrobacteraceae bacterium]
MSTQTIKTNVTELPESRVRVEVEVVPEEIERSLADLARKVGRELKVPGFRKGKIPAPVVIRRVGRASLLDEAVREQLPFWYSDAIDAARLAIIGDPEINRGDLPAAGESLHFTIEIGVRPKATLGEWRGLEVERRQPSVNPKELEHRLQTLRERHGRLENLPDREAETGDFVVIDFEGRIDGKAVDGGVARAYPLELGSGKLIPGFESGLLGARAGEQRVLELTFPDNYGNPDLRGEVAEFTVDVKDVRAKILPDLDDDFANEAGGYETLDELRDEISKELLEQDERRAEREYREAVVAAAAATIVLDVPEPLVQARADEAWERMLRSLADQGISKEAYLQLAQKPEEQVRDEAKPDALDALRREATIVALIESEGIEPTEFELIEALQEHVAPDESGKIPEPEELLEKLRKSGRITDLIENVAARKAVDVLVDAAITIPAKPPTAAAGAPASGDQPGDPSEPVTADAAAAGDDQASAESAGEAPPAE